jgi:hypothetical protein
MQRASETTPRVDTTCVGDDAEGEGSHAAEMTPRHLCAYQLESKGTTE